MNSNKEKLEQLKETEQLIAFALQNAGHSLGECSKEKPNPKQVEAYTATFLKTLAQVENNLSKHINYLTQVSTGQPHTRSSYSAKKDHQMSCHRVQHVLSRLKELDNSRLQKPLPQIPPQTDMSPAFPPPPTFPAPPTNAPGVSIRHTLPPAQRHPFPPGMGDTPPQGVMPPQGGLPHQDSFGS